MEGLYYTDEYEKLLDGLIRLAGRFNKLFKAGEWCYLDKKNLGDQLNRALTSIPSNLEEGRGRGFNEQYQEEANFLRYALGSARESRVQIKIARSSGLLKETAHGNAVRILTEAIEFIEDRLTEIKGKRRSGGNLSSKDDEPEPEPDPGHVDNEVDELDDDDPFKEEG